METTADRHFRRCILAAKDSEQTQTESLCLRCEAERMKVVGQVV
jgi:hypothetical protein